MKTAFIRRKSGADNTKISPNNKKSFALCQLIFEINGVRCIPTILIVVQSVICSLLAVFTNAMFYVLKRNSSFVLTYRIFEPNYNKKLDFLSPFERTELKKAAKFFFLRNIFFIRFKV